MNKNVKHNKKEEQKKLMVRIVCMVLVVALAVTSLLAMFPTLFQSHDHDSYTVDELLQMGIIAVGEDGNYYVVDGALEGEDHTGHNHD
jgi:hypothetical protein